jgi:hypothetical protein
LLLMLLRRWLRLLHLLAWLRRRLPLTLLLCWLLCRRLLPQALWL